MKEIAVHTDQLKEMAPNLRAGDRVLLSGTVYTARDAAHKRMFAQMEAGENLPFPWEGAAVYYAGPTPAPENLPIGACGPTTSSRMDVFAPAMLDKGLTCMIGKGPRSKEVCDAICRNGGVYLCAIGGAGALAAKCVQSLEVIDYEDLGCESVKRLAVKDFPLIVAIDAVGGNLFEKK